MTKLKSTLISVLFCCLLTSRAIPIGKLSQYLYIPSSSSTGVVLYSFSTNCHECLCYAKSLTTRSFVLINCLTLTQTCYLYPNYTDSYSFQTNTIGIVYFFQLPTQQTTTLLNIFNPTSSNYPTYNLYSFIWTARANRTTLSFISRHDPGGWLLDNVIVNRSSTSLIVNGGFETGSLTGWNYSGSCRSYPGSVDSSYAAQSGSFYYYSTCVNITEKISQSISTIIGVSYQISFWLTNRRCCSPVASFAFVID